MKIIDLIEKLQTLYNTYTDADKAIMGEPEIMIDVFRLKHHESIGFDIPACYDRVYAGFGKDIVISKTDDGVYDILSAFYEDQTTETPESPGSFVQKP